MGISLLFINEQFSACDGWKFPSFENEFADDILVYNLENKKTEQKLNGGKGQLRIKKDFILSIYMPLIYFGAVLWFIHRNYLKNLLNAAKFS